MFLKNLLRFIDNKNRILLFLLLVLIIVSSFFAIWPITLVKKMVDLAIPGINENIRIILLTGAVYLATQVLRAFLIASMSYLSDYIQTDMGITIQNRVYKKLLGTSIKQFQNRTSIEITNTLVEDTDFVIQNLMKPFTLSIMSIISFSIGLYYMLNINALLTLMIIPLGLITSLTVRFISGKSSKNAEDMRKNSNKLWKIFSEGIRGIIPIRLHGYQGEYSRKVSESSHNMKKTKMSQSKIDAFSYFASSSLFMITIGGILTYSGVLVVEEGLSIGGLTAVMMYNHMLVDPLIDVLELQQKFIKLKISIKRIGELFSLKDDEMLDKKEIEADRIALDGVNFSYSSEKTGYNLKGIDISISKSSNIAIVGKTGSGKSTLANIIAGLYKPDSGNVTFYKNEIPIDGRAKLSYLTQDEYIFDTTIEQNILMANPYLTKTEIDKLIDVCELGEVLTEHRHENLGEGGNFLSGGERKRLRLARTLARKDADIYIFDELTTSLDNAMAEKLIGNVTEMLSDKICIFIEHDMKTASKMDRIISIKEGEIDFMGKYEDYSVRV